MTNTDDFSIAFSDQGTGTPILWLHGLMMGSEVDEQLHVINFQQLSQSARIIRIDSPGHGQSLPAENTHLYKWDQLPNVYTHVEHKLNIQDKIIAGFSMGSAAAIHYACQFHQHTKALILAMPPKIWAQRPEQCKAYQKMAKLASTNRFKQLLPRLLNDTPVQFVEDAFPGSRRIATQAMSNLSSEVYPQLFSAAAQSDYPDKELVVQLDIPVLILGWEGDDTHPISSIDQLKTVLPKAEIHIAENIDQLNQFTSVVENFVRKISSE